MCRPLPGVKTTIGVPVAPTRADIRAAVPARRLGHGDLATGLDPGQELFVRGGVIEQHRHPGVEVRGAPVGDGELEHVTAAEVLRKVSRDHRVERLIGAHGERVDERLRATDARKVLNEVPMAHGPRRTAARHRRK